LSFTQIFTLEKDSTMKHTLLITTFVTMIFMLLFMTGCQDSQSIGIIGGADGPTSIIISNGSKDTEKPNEAQNIEEETEMNNPQITITMEDGGVIVAELYPDKAPNTVNNFIYLVEEGFYDGVIFHRVIENFMIQGGDPEGTGRGGPGYSIKGEFYNNNFPLNDIVHERGVLSMARTPMPDSAGSQFFIMVEDSPHLDNDYAAFGRVIEGMDVVDAIVSVDTDRNDKPLVDQRIATITVDTFGVEYPEPVKIGK
jgi:peptidyl-prolyl cis-trans isomerase B (cyclophilin B)